MKPRSVALLATLLVCAALALLPAKSDTPDAEPVRTPPVQTRPAKLDGAGLVKKYQCTFCHITEETDKRHILDPRANCVYCHASPTHGPNKDRPIVRYYAPNFDRLGAHLRPEWMRGFLEEPYSVRPQLREHMPDFLFQPGEVDLLVDYLLNRSEAPPSHGDATLLARQPEARHNELIEQGRRAAARFWCFGCHEFTGFIASQATKTGPANTLTEVAYFAPDLRHSRDRLRPEVIAGMILDPKAHNPLSLKPKPYGLSAGDADALAYMILFADLDPNAPPPAEETFEVIAEPEYERDIAPLFTRYCEACHYPEDNEMMGPASGFVGAFGLPARHFDVTTYEGVMKGASLDGRVFYDVVIPEYRASILLNRLRGDMTPAMPFGQKMPEGAIQTIENWVMQGAKGPEEKNEGEDDGQDENK